MAPGIVDSIRSKIYGSFFGPQNPVSTQWAYDAILNKIPEGSSILDIGCGDGIYFTNPQVMATVRRKQFTIYAIDIDAGAVEICQARVAAAGLGGQVTCEAIDVTKVTQTFDYVLWMESFPVIPSSIFPPLFKHSLTLTKKKTMLYHNLVPDADATWFWRWSKPLLVYLTLCDFGKLTTLTEMDVTMRALTPRPFTMAPLLECQLSDMHVLGWVASWVVNQFKSGGGDRKVSQYLLEVDSPEAK